MTTSPLKIVKLIIPTKHRLSIRISLMRFIGHFYRGKALRCNLCGKTFRKMMAHGNIPRPNAKCPNCLSLERTRVLWFYLKEHVIDTNTPLRVLHFAPEYGLKKVLRKYKNIRYTNVDINPDLADEVADITQIPYEEESFDLVLCSHVLGHVPNEKKAIEELYRVLTPTGQALVMTIIDWSKKNTFEDSRISTPRERLENYTEPDLVRLHGRDFADRLRDGGFNVEVIDYSNLINLDKKKYYSLGNGDREIIFKCTRPTN